MPGAIPIQTQPSPSVGVFDSDHSFPGGQRFGHVFVMFSYVLLGVLDDFGVLRWFLLGIFTIFSVLLLFTWELLLKSFDALPSSSCRLRATCGDIDLDKESTFCLFEKAKMESS